MDGHISTLSTIKKRYMEGTGSASIAQWLESRPSDPAVVGSSAGWGGHICACHIIEV